MDNSNRLPKDFSIQFVGIFISDLRLLPTSFLVVAMTIYC